MNLLAEPLAGPGARLYARPYARFGGAKLHARLGVARLGARLGAGLLAGALAGLLSGLLPACAPPPPQSGAPPATPAVAGSPEAPSSRAPEDSARVPLSLLPSDDLPTGWRQAEAPRLYAGRALYQHINGGAEPYLERGFVSVAVAPYGGGGEEITVEVYDMGTRAGARSAFVLNADPERETAATRDAAGPAYGEACALDPLQILFHQDRYYAVVTRYESGEATAPVLAALARSVERRIAELRDRGR